MTGRISSEMSNTRRTPRGEYAASPQTLKLLWLGKRKKSDYKPVPIRQTRELNSFQLTSCLGNGSPEALWEEESMSLPCRKTLDTVFLYSYNTRVKSQPRCCPYLAKLGSSMCRRWVNLASDRSCLFEALPWDLPSYSFEYIWRSRNFYLCSFHKR